MSEDSGVVQDGSSSISTTTPTGSSSNSRFKDMKFKEKLKTSGRPKKGSKQVRFNRTAIDAQRDMASKRGKQSTESKQRGKNRGSRGGRGADFRSYSQTIENMTEDSMADELLQPPLDLPVPLLDSATLPHLALPVSLLESTTPFTDSISQVPSSLCNDTEILGSFRSTNLPQLSDGNYFSVPTTSKNSVQVKGEYYTFATSSYNNVPFVNHLRHST